jgi:predicted nucleic acid-binding protein
MTTALDSNILIALWETEHTLSLAANLALKSARAVGNLIISAPVYAELLAGAGRTGKFLDSFFSATGIAIDWDLTESIWRSAGLAHQSYAARRRKQRNSEPRRIQADFLIGAHALEHEYDLLTLDERLYAAAFPRLVIKSI